jgi:hypothetical protein
LAKAQTSVKKVFCPEKVYYYQNYTKDIKNIKQSLVWDLNEFIKQNKI